MSSLPYDRLDALTQELFRYALDAKMPLTLDQLQMLRVALSKGFGLGGWSDLYRIGMRLWVKPTSALTEPQFSEAFERLREAHRQKTEPDAPEPKPPRFREGSLPELPPQRSMPQEETRDGEVPIAVKLPTESSDGRSSQEKQTRTGYRYTPSAYPISAEEFLVFWRQMKQSLRQQSANYALDIDASVARICQEGIGAELVLRPVLSKGLELVVFLDDSYAMKPYHWAFNPLLKQLQVKRIYPSQVFRIDSYPADSFAHWSDPTRFEPLDTLLTRWSSSKTVLLIFSDAGAARGSRQKERALRTAEFMARINSGVRTVLWINPLPMSRWKMTPAHTIATFMNGNMTTMGVELLDQSRRLTQWNLRLEV